MNEAETQFRPCKAIMIVSVINEVTQLNARVSLLDTKTHARAARECNKPIVQLWRLEPAFRDKFVRIGEDVSIVVNKRTAARNDSLEPSQPAVELYRG